MNADQDLFERARKVIPGGVSSPVRAFGSVGGAPVFVSRASGPYIVGADGVEYVDLVCSWGPALLGHAHPEVVEAVREAALAVDRRAIHRAARAERAWCRDLVAGRRHPGRGLDCNSVGVESGKRNRGGVSPRGSCVDAPLWCGHTPQVCRRVRLLRRPAARPRQFR